MAWYDQQPTNPSAWGRPPEPPSAAVRRNRHIAKVVMLVVGVGLFTLLIAWPLWTLLLNAGR